MTSTALQKREAGHLAKPISSTAQLFNAYPAEKYNVLAPVTHMERLPAGTTLGVTVIGVDTSKSAREIFDVGSGQNALSKVVLDRISRASGISWTDVARIDDGSHPHYYHMRVSGHFTDFDGVTKQIGDAKAVDLRDDAGGGIAGKDIRPGMKAKELEQARKFIAEIATSKAKNRAIAGGLGIKRSYTMDELKRPFVVPKLIPDTRDPEMREVVQANAAGATAALYGSREKIVDAKFEEAAGPSNGGEEVAGDSPPPVTSNIPHDPETGEVLENLEVGTPQVVEIITRAWDVAKGAGMKAPAFVKLCESNTGKTDRNSMTLDDAKKVWRAIDAYTANAGTDTDLPV